MFAVQSLERPPGSRQSEEEEEGDVGGKEDIDSQQEE